jgi:hypothetical protein
MHYSKSNAGRYFKQKIQFLTAVTSQILNLCNQITWIILAIPGHSYLLGPITSDPLYLCKKDFMYKKSATFSK